jgi:hypothetical protein
MLYQVLREVLFQAMLYRMRHPAPFLIPLLCSVGAHARLGAPLAAQVGTALGAQVIRESQGGFGGDLDPLDAFGSAVARLGDLDGDGVDDLAVGAAGDDDGGGGQGAVWVLFMNADGTVASEAKISETEGGFGGVLDSSDSFGYSLAALGDLDGNGTADLAVGAPFDGDGGFSQGAVWILFLNADGTVAAHTKISETAGGFGGELDLVDNFGVSVAALGDLDQDGIEDLAVGASGDDDGGFAQGAVWILFLNADGSVSSETKISGSLAFDPGDYFGSSLATLGDLDGDGLQDLAVGAVGDDDDPLPTLVSQGAVYILFLNTDGTPASGSKISETAGGFGGDLDPEEFFGCSVAALGDLDGDGVEDLGVGARFDSDGGFGRGAVWVLFLNADGTVASETKLSATVGGLEGDLTPFGNFGWSLAALGDLDGDGVRDLAVGAIDGEPDLDRQGALWILFLEGCRALDFESEDDFETPLVNGQEISTPPEFGSFLAVTSSGPNAGAAIFDSTLGGPNDLGPDPDLLVDRGNVLILQSSDSATQSVPRLFDHPDDGDDGGTLSFAFASPVMLRSIDLVDIDAGADEASRAVLVDVSGRRRIYWIPAGWTGDRAAGQPGVLTLDLTLLAPQVGWAATVHSLQYAGFRADQVVRLDVHLGSSGALDNLVWCPPGPAVHSGPRWRR